MRTILAVMVLAVHVAMAQAATAGAAAGSVEVRLTNGRVLRAISASRVGDVYRVCMANGTLDVPASRVESVRTASGSTGARTGFNVLPQDVVPAPAPAVDPKAAVPSAASVDAVLGAAGVSALVSSGDLVAAESTLRKGLVEHPGDPVRLVALGELLVRQGRFDEALAALAAAVDAPRDLARQRDMVRARALSRLDRPDDALAAIAATPDDTKGSVAGLRDAIARDMATRQESELFPATHFRIQAPAGTDRRQGEVLVRELEATWTLLHDAFGAAPPEKVIVVLYPGRDFWSETSSGSNVGGLFDGKVRVPAGRIDPPSERLRAVLRHEVAHAFVDALSGGRADRDWHEGIAEHFEGSDVGAVEIRLAQERAAAPAAWPPRLDHDSAHARTEYFLRTHGMSALRDMLLALGHGASPDEALESVIGMSEARLDEAWGQALAPSSARR